MIDDVDANIILQLQRDARRSCARIAKDAGIPQSTARHRLRRIFGSGVVRVVAAADPLLLGLARRAVIGIWCTGDPSELADRLADLPAVSLVALTAGSFDVVIKVDCGDDDALLGFVDTELRAIPGVLATEAMVCLKVLKHHGHDVHTVAGRIDAAIIRALPAPPTA